MSADQLKMLESCISLRRVAYAFTRNHKELTAAELLEIAVNEESRISKRIASMGIELPVVR